MVVVIIIIVVVVMEFIVSVHPLVVVVVVVVVVEGESQQRQIRYKDGKFYCTCQDDVHHRKTGLMEMNCGTLTQDCKS